MTKKESQDPLTKEKALEQLREAYTTLREAHGLSFEEVLNQLQQPKAEIEIPYTIFSPETSGLETITKYLKENQELSLKEIARKLNRKYRTVWGAYMASQKKKPQPLIPSPTPYRISLHLFSERKLSVLETLTHHLRTHYRLRYSQIAKLLHRDPRTIWTTEHKAQLRLRKEITGQADSQQRLNAELNNAKALSSPDKPAHTRQAGSEKKTT